ncbi:MAG: efflux RND transporter periplasmic adaptor subunit [Gemmatimonadota bacterium]
MKTRTKFVAGTMVVAAFGIAAAVTVAGGKEDDDTRTVEVVRGNIVRKALAVGRIEPEVEVSVKSQLSGVVRKEFADMGDFVRAGAPLLEIQPNPTPLELVEARRQVEMNGIGLAELKRRRDRLDSLRSNNYVSQEEFEAVDRQYSEARLRLKMARERLALLESGRVTIGKQKVETTITSPITGFVLEKMVEIGDPVVPLTTYQEGTVLLTMAEMGHLLFRGTVDEIDVGLLRESMPATIKIGALPGSSIQGELTKISLKGKKEENATKFPVEIALHPNDTTVLRAGYSANADIVVERRDSVLVIPERLIRFSGDTTRVQVKLAGAKTEERVIRTGLSDGIHIEVLSGLEEGERVVEPPPREIS